MHDSITAGKLLRIFVDEADRYHGKPLFVAIVDAMLAAGFSGATVLKGIEGYGLHKTIHTSRVFDASTNLPVLIEVMEREDTIVSFLPQLRAMMAEGLITLENVQLMRFSRGRP